VRRKNLMATESTETTEKTRSKKTIMATESHGITRKNKCKNEKSKKGVKPVVSLCGDHNYYQFVEHTLFKNIEYFCVIPWLF
jgi:hypothetical protein